MLSMQLGQLQCPDEGISLQRDSTVATFHSQQLFFWYECGPSTRIIVCTSKTLASSLQVIYKGTDTD